MIVLVKDAKGTSRWKHPYSCSCKSWIEHWRRNWRRPVLIVCLHCGQPITEDNPLVGAHVQKVQEIWGDVDKNYYIIPVCNSCNSSGDFFVELDEDYLVPVKKGNYCA